MDDKPLVSIVALFYDQRRYVGETVRSIFAQTYPNCEIILSDDCSSDGTGQVLREIAAGYKGNCRVIVNVNERNLGIGNHCAKVFSMCSGEWIVPCGGDDSFTPGRVQKIVEYANEYPHVVAIGCSSVEVDGEGRRLRECALVDKPVVYPKYESGSFTYELSPAKKASMCFIAGALAAWHRRVLGMAPFPRNVIAEDVVLSLRACLMGDILFIPEKLVFRRCGGISSAGRDSRARSDRRAYRRRVATMCFRSEKAILDEVDSYPFRVSKEFRERLLVDNSSALLKCFDHPVADDALYDSALEVALCSQGFGKTFKGAFSTGNFFKFAKVYLRYLFHKLRGRSSDSHEKV